MSFFNFGSKAEIFPYSNFKDGTLLKQLRENEEMALSHPKSKNWKKVWHLALLKFAETKCL